MAIEFVSLDLLTYSSFNCLLTEVQWTGEVMESLNCNAFVGYDYSNGFHP